MLMEHGHKVWRSQVYVRSGAKEEYHSTTMSIVSLGHITGRRN